MARPVGSGHEDLTLYLREIRRVPLLTEEQERELARQWRGEQSEAARQRLVCSNLRLAVYVAKRYAGLGLPLLDLVEAANLGLLRAVDRFDPDLGARLATFAMWWMRRAIVTALSQHGHLVHLPERQRRLRQACREAVERVRSARGRRPSTQELAHETGLSTSVVMRTEQGARAMLRPMADQSDAIAALPDPWAGEPADGIQRREATGRLRGCMGTLPEDEAETLRLHFGLGHRRALPVREVARHLGMHESRARGLLRTALARLEAMLAEPPAGKAQAAPQSA
jgi:RNA polymerase sigma factor (sigma-70 family)